MADQLLLCAVKGGERLREMMAKVMQAFSQGKGNTFQVWRVVAACQKAARKSGRAKEVFPNCLVLVCVSVVCAVGAAEATGVAEVKEWARQAAIES